MNRRLINHAENVDRKVNNIPIFSLKQSMEKYYEHNINLQQMLFVEIKIVFDSK